MGNRFPARPTAFAVETPPSRERLAESRTIKAAGSRVWRPSALPAQEVLVETQDAILPLVPYLDSLRWVFIAAALAGQSTRASTTDEVDGLCSRLSVPTRSRQETPDADYHHRPRSGARMYSRLHAVDDAGQPVIRRRHRRNQVLTFRWVATVPFGLEACSGYFWARELIALGHDATIAPPSYVKRYVRRGMNDSADAAAICEAVSRPRMRFVPVKSEEQQVALMLHKAPVDSAALYVSRSAPGSAARRCVFRDPRLPAD